jgi:hypothetical protein
MYKKEHPNQNQNESKWDQFLKKLWKYLHYCKTSLRDQLLLTSHIIQIIINYYI